MTSDPQQILAADCAALASSADAARDWVRDPANAGLVGAEVRSLTRDLRRAGRRARRLERAAGTPMSVSVFGPSQAGKSFLVSVLARPESGPLVADFAGPDGQLDYIRQINPEGEGESTGLVTRFTMRKAPTPEGFPIRLVLLSEADLARTLINSFFMDGDGSEDSPDAAALGAHLDAFRDRSGTPRPGLSADDVWEIAEYVQTSFGREAYAQALQPFWEEASEIAPGLGAADRGRFFSILWGGHEPFSDLYGRLADALGQIGHAEEVFAGLDALIPRDTSIIDVKTLSGAADGAPLSVRPANGVPVALPRSVVCALAAELVLPMRDQPSPLFATTDLLDFPGARNRFERDLAVAFAEPDRILPELLLRGKVAYLFDRYVQNQEITSMLLCVPDSNLETVDLPGLVQSWIATTHGASPAERVGAETVLFFVLTKFDKHLQESAADSGAESRFSRRMFSSLLEKFGKGNDPWVDQWTPGRPFDNCYWLRNPNYFVKGLIDYDEAQRELRLRPDEADRIAALREGCLAAPEVARHFADPAAAWDAALALNDGGVSHLLRALDAVCRPDSKLRQIRGQLDALRAGMVQALRPFHVSDDVEQRVEEKRAAAARVIDDLEAALAQHRFGAVLHALMVDQDEIETRISRVPSWVRLTSAVSSAAAAAPDTAKSSPPRPGRPMRPGRPAASEAPAAAPAEASGGAIRTMTLEEFQAGTAIETWIDRLKAFRDTGAGPSRLGVTDDAASDLAAELIHAARRTGLGRRIADQLREVNFGLIVERQAAPAAIVGAERINGFVATLGMDDVDPDDRPRVPGPDGGETPVFQVVQGADSVDDLPLATPAFAERVWSDWVYALEAVFVANAKDGAGGDIDIEQNLALGRILAGMTQDGGGAAA